VIWLPMFLIPRCQCTIGLLPLHSCCIYFGYAGLIYWGLLSQASYSFFTHVILGPWGTLPWLRCLLIRGEDWWWQLKDWISPLTELKRAEELCWRQKNLVSQFFRTFTNSDSHYYMLILLYVPISAALSVQSAWVCLVLSCVTCIERRLGFTLLFIYLSAVS